MLAATAGMALVVASSALAADPVSLPAKYSKYYCNEMFPADMLPANTIGYQRVSELKPITAATGILTTWKTLANPWSAPSNVAVYAYPLENVIGPNGPSLSGVPPTEFLAIVNGNQETGYFGTQVDWTTLQAIDRFQGSGVDADSTATNDMGTANIDAFLKLGVASGMLDKVLNSELIHDALSVAYTQEECITLDISDETKYKELKNDWEERDNYLVTTNPIPGLEKEKPFLTQWQ